MVNNASSSQPSRLSVAMFLHMAPIWEMALGAYPNVVEVSPGTLSVETFARKFREAREAWFQCGYQFKMQRHQDAMKLYGHLITTHMQDNGTLLLGPRDAIKAHKTAALDAKVRQVQGLSPAPTVEDTTIAAQWVEPFLSMLNAGALSPRPTNFVFSKDGWDAAYVASLEEKYPNVGLVEEFAQWRIV